MDNSFSRVDLLKKVEDIPGRIEEKLTINPVIEEKQEEQEVEVPKINIGEQKHPLVIPVDEETEEEAEKKPLWKIREEEKQKEIEKEIEKQRDKYRKDYFVSDFQYLVLKEFFNNKYATQQQIADKLHTNKKRISYHLKQIALNNEHDDDLQRELKCRDRRRRLKVRRL